MASRLERLGSSADENHWPDWANLVLGIWLFISPWALGFASSGPSGGTNAAPGGGSALSSASWDAWIVGILIALVAISALSRMALWQEWVNLILGAWVVIAPWALGFSNISNAAWDHWIVGFLVFIFSLASVSAMRRRSADLAHAGDKPGPRL
jgi:hypothetical protein